MRLLARQSMILAVVWAVSGLTYLVLNLGGVAALWIPTLLAVVFGGTAAASLSLLLTQRSLRPIMLAATQGTEGLVVAPSVLTRLVGMWLLGSGLPCLAIAGLVLTRSNGWIIQKTGSVEMPILVVTLVAILIGLPVMIMTSRSISDPVREVVDAMARVERGNIDTFVGVYEKSEIGRLQDGFNRMVAGIGERDRLRDLFGRHVGADVARRAIEEGTSLSGDVREAAILFIDLVGSTTLAASRPPQEVARILNDFFRIVVSAVDDHRGLINKFQGDAVLAVFGAPLAHDDSASAALATARLLRTNCSGCRRSTSGSVYPPGRCSPETSAPKTVTNTPLSATRSTKRRAWPTSPRLWISGSCARPRPLTAPTPPSVRIGCRIVRRCCAAARTPPRSGHRRARE